MASNYILNPSLEAVQKQILNLVSAEYSDVYLVGGTAISLLYQHRVSEGLDFFVPKAYYLQ